MRFLGVIVMTLGVIVILVGMEFLAIKIGTPASPSFKFAGREGGDPAAQVSKERTSGGRSQEWLELIGPWAVVLIGLGLVVGGYHLRRKAIKARNKDPISQEERMKRNGFALLALGAILIFLAADLVVITNLGTSASRTFSNVSEAIAGERTSAGKPQGWFHSTEGWSTLLVAGVIGSSGLGLVIVGARLRYRYRLSKTERDQASPQ